MKERIKSRAAELARNIGIDDSKIKDLYRNIDTEYHAPETDAFLAASMIDHTILSFDAKGSDVERVCNEAAQNNFKAICINPVWIKTAVEKRTKLRSEFLIATVVDFPLGASNMASRIEETKQALADGADEIDLVISIGLLKSGMIAETFRLMKEVADTGCYLKVILETSELEVDEKIDAAVLAYFAGAHMLKTSTGVNGKATVEDVRLLRTVAGSELGVKAAGGIRDKETLIKMVEAGADRIGCSSSVRIIQEW